MTNQSTSECAHSLVQGSGTRFFVDVCLVVVVVVRAKLDTAAESVGEGCCRSCVMLGEGRVMRLVECLDGDDVLAGARGHSQVETQLACLCYCKALGIVGQGVVCVVDGDVCSQRSKLVAYRRGRL